MIITKNMYIKKKVKEEIELLSQDDGIWHTFIIFIMLSIFLSFHDKYLLP